LFDNQQILAFIVLDIIKIPLKKGRSTKLHLEKKEEKKCTFNSDGDLP
jgi:hypothetical protein